MKPAATLITLLVVIGACNCNIWDNIFSETEASSPILVEGSMHFEVPFKYQSYNLLAKINFNDEHKILFGEFFALLFGDQGIGVAKFKLDLETMLLNVSTIMSCYRYKLELFE